MRELKRQTFHLILGLFLLLLTISLSSEMLIVSGIAFFVLSMIVLHALKNKKIINKIISEAERPQEKEFKGLAIIVFFMGFLIFGILTFLLNFSLTEKLFVLIPFALSDSFSALIGFYAGRHKIIGNKTIEGTTAFFVSAVICLMLLNGFQIYFVLAYALIETA